MSKPRIATCADAVIAEMEDVADDIPSGWSQAFQIERVYNDRQPKEEMDDLVLRVMCGESVPTRKTRKHRQWMHQIQIAVKKNVDPSNVDAIDALADFAESIAEYWSAGDNDGLRVIDGTQATVASVSYLPYSPDQLDTGNVFISVITLSVVEMVAVNPPAVVWNNGTTTNVNGSSDYSHTGTTFREATSPGQAQGVYSHGQTDPTETKCKISFGGITAADLEGKYAEVGCGIRVASSGDILRNGYYATVYLSYSGGVQTAYLRLATQAGVVSYVTLTGVGLSTIYRLIVRDTGAAVTVFLTDEEQTVMYATVAANTTTYGSNTYGSIYFKHHGTLNNFALPYLKDLTVTAPIS